MSRFQSSIFLVAFALALPAQSFAQNSGPLVDDLPTSRICRKQINLIYKGGLGKTACGIAAVFDSGFLPPEKKFKICMKSANSCFSDLKKKFDQDKCEELLSLKRARAKRKKKVFCPLPVAVLDECFRRSSEELLNLTPERLCGGGLEIRRPLLPGVPTPAAPPENDSPIPPIPACEKYAAKCPGLAGKDD